MGRSMEITMNPTTTAITRMIMGSISEVVKTQYGYHIIEPLSPVRGSFGAYKDVVRATLVQQQKNEMMQAWVEDLTKEYKSTVKYAEGYAPPELPEVPTTATE